MAVIWTKLLTKHKHYDSLKSSELTIKSVLLKQLLCKVLLVMKCVQLGMQC